MSDSDQSTKNQAAGQQLDLPPNCPACKAAPPNWGRCEVEDKWEMFNGKKRRLEAWRCSQCECLMRISPPPSWD